MKLASRLFVCVVFLLVCAAPLVAANATSSAHGQIRFAASGTATLRFSVRQDAVSGDTSGRIDYSDDSVTFSADVNCAVFGVDQASLSGVVTSAPAPALIGTQTLLSVQDNGQGNGKNAVPDLYTFVMTSTLDCHAFPPPAQTVTDGQVHVRPATVPFF
jgi:hypothetical protein